jgi:hypothetical protein
MSDLLDHHLDEDQPSFENFQRFTIFRERSLSVTAIFHVQVVVDHLNVPIGTLPRAQVCVRGKSQLASKLTRLCEGPFHFANPGEAYCIGRHREIGSLYHLLTCLIPLARNYQSDFSHP